MFLMSLAGLERTLPASYYSLKAKKLRVDLLESVESLKAVSISEGRRHRGPGVLGLNINQLKRLIKELTRKKTWLWLPTCLKLPVVCWFPPTALVRPSGPHHGMRSSEADASHRWGATRGVSGVVCTPPAIRLYHTLRLDGWRRTGGGYGRHLSPSLQEKYREKNQSTPTPIAGSSLMLSKHVAVDASRPSMHYAWPPFSMESRALQPTDLGDGDSRLSGWWNDATCRIFRAKFHLWSLRDLKVGGKLRVCSLEGHCFWFLHLCITHQVSVWFEDGERRGCCACSKPLFPAPPRSSRDGSLCNFLIQEKWSKKSCKFCWLKVCSNRLDRRGEREFKHRCLSCLKNNHHRAIEMAIITCLKKKIWEEKHGTC